MEWKKKLGVLLLNTGSSSAPRTCETRVYLRQFLSDPRVMDIAWWKRWLLLNCFILPFRPTKTAEAYRTIWTERGSPLIAISEDFRAALAEQLPGVEVALGMAYGSPSIRDGIEVLMGKQLDRILVAPMYPQYASATTGSVVSAVYRIAAEKWNVAPLSVLPPYYRDPGYLDAWYSVAGPVLEAFRPEHVLLSFHGLPERHILKGDLTKKYCLVKPNCCELETEANQFCYRRHCLETSRGLVARLGIAVNRHSVSFQSRLGRNPWLGPDTAEMVVTLAQSGVKRLAVMSPAFVADCLETLEEIGLRAKESFLENGGEEFILVPSLNTHPKWVAAMARLLEEI